MLSDVKRDRFDEMALLVVNPGCSHVPGVTAPIACQDCVAAALRETDRVAREAELRWAAEQVRGWRTGVTVNLATLADRIERGPTPQEEVKP